MSYVPTWWEFFLLALAAFRVWRLLAEDTILDRPRAWLLGLPPDWQEGQRVPESYREELGKFITCPWCAGFWITLCWWGAWLLWPHWALVAATPWALNAILALAAKNLDE